MCGGIFRKLKEMFGKKEEQPKKERKRK